MPTLQDILEGTGQTNQQTPGTGFDAIWLANLAKNNIPSYITDPRQIAALLRQGQNAGNLFATGGQPLPSRQVPAYRDLRNVFSAINALPPQLENEDLPYDLMYRAGIPDSIAQRLLATAAYARNEDKAKPAGWRPTTFQESGLEQLFRQWIAQNHLSPFEATTYFPQYDMRGWFQAMMNQDPQAIAKPGFRNNQLVPLFTNRFETPYSLTFGPQSVYYDSTKASSGR